LFQNLLVQINFLTLKSTLVFRDQNCQPLKNLEILKKFLYLILYIDSFISDL